MTIPVVVFVMTVVLVIVVPTGMSLMFVALTYEAGGFRHAARSVVREHIKTRIPDPEHVRLEVTALVKLDALLKEPGEPTSRGGSPDTRSRDQALAVFAGREGALEFLNALENRRRELQQVGVRRIRRRLETTDDLTDLVENADRWIAMGERRLRWLSIREIGAQVGQNVWSLTNTAFASGALGAFILAIVASSISAVTRHTFNIEAIAFAATMILGALSIGRGWLSVGRRAARAAGLGDVPRSIVKVALGAGVAVVTLSVLVETLISLSVMARFWRGGSATLGRWIDGLHISPSLAACIGVGILSWLFLWIALGCFRVARARQVVAWQRVRASGAVFACSWPIPVDLYVAQSLISHGVLMVMPRWVAVCAFACWSVSGCVFMISVVLRRQLASSQKTHGRVQDAPVSAPLGVRSMNRVGILGACLGAALSVVAVFIKAIGNPSVNGILVSVRNGSLLQAKDGSLVIALAIVGLVLLGWAYSRGSRAPLWGTVITGLLIVGVAIADGLNFRVSYILPLTAELRTVKAPAGAGIYLAGIGGAIMAAGAFISSVPFTSRHE
jgi:hypothetical protein